MSKVKDTEYLHLSAYLRAREASLLSAERLERMASAADAAEALRLLSEAGYPDLAGASDREFEDALAKRRAAELSDVERLCPEKDVVTAFRLRYDYHNAKVLVKSGGSLPEGANLYSGCGRVEPDVLVNAYREDVWGDVPPALASAITAARDALARTSNPQLADMDLDKACFAEMLSLTKGLSDGFYYGYARLMIDAANLRSAVRCLRGGMDDGVLRAALIPGGTVDPDRISELTYSEGPAAAFANGPLAQAAALGADAAQGAPLAGFEKACDNALMEHLAAARRTAFGPAVAVGYLSAVEAEIVAARMVVQAKKSGVPADILRERLRDAYV
ncbi:MAG: V-type ATPase subunit [Lachnospiraceae bacterium]|nr:V-type ATPase subunit [Lachnospiraceae bacterium]